MARGSIFDLMIGVPSDCSGAFAGCERMPAALRARGLADSLGVIDAGNLQVVVADPVRDRETGVIGLTDLLGLSEVVRDAVSMHLTAGRRPLLVGGDCTLLLGVWAALARVRPDAGLLFVDGHLDCFDGQTSPTGEGADMELAALLGVGPPPLVGFAGRVPALSDERVVVLGPFDEDDAQGLGAPNPRRFAPRMPIVVSVELQQDPSGHTTRALARLTETADGFWLHLDLDVLSASALPAVDYADERGLSWEQLCELLGVALGSWQLIGASVVILNPTLDTDGAGARRVVRLLADAQDQARQQLLAPPGCDVAKINGTHRAIEGTGRQPDRLRFVASRVVRPPAPLPDFSGPNQKPPTGPA